MNIKYLSLVYLIKKWNFGGNIGI